MGTAVLFVAILPECVEMHRGTHRLQLRLHPRPLGVYKVGRVTLYPHPFHVVWK